MKGLERRVTLRLSSDSHVEHLYPPPDAPKFFPSSFEHAPEARSGHKLTLNVADT